PIAPKHIAWTRLPPKSSPIPKANKCGRGSAPIKPGAVALVPVGSRNTSTALELPPRGRNELVTLAARAAIATRTKRPDAAGMRGHSELRDALQGEHARSLTELREAEAACTRCPLYRFATQVVPGEGRAHARLMLVGEQPGDQEDLAGKPFVGPAGRILDQALEQAGVSRKDVFVTNAVKHFKHEMRRKPRPPKPPDAHPIPPPPPSPH